MAGVFDYHVQLYLRKSWVLLAADQADFVAMFGGLIATSILQTYHGLLAPAGSTKGVVFASAYGGDIPAAVQVTTSLRQEPPDEEFLGQSSNDPDEVISFVKETVEITCHSHNDELTRALHVVIHRLMLRSVGTFHGAGYVDGPYFDGGGDVGPEEKLIPNAYGPFARTQRWRVLTPAISETSDGLVTKGLVVAAVDATVGGVSGGISPNV